VCEWRVARRLSGIREEPVLQDRVHLCSLVPLVWELNFEVFILMEMLSPARL
jgi:hypothetical protein